MGELTHRRLIHRKTRARPPGLKLLEGCASLARREAPHVALPYRVAEQAELAAVEAVRRREQDMEVRLAGLLQSGRLVSQTETDQVEFTCCTHVLVRPQVIRTQADIESRHR